MVAVNHDLLQLLADNCGEGMLVTDSRDEILYLNKQAQTLLNIAPSSPGKITSHLPLEQARTDKQGRKILSRHDKVLALRVQKTTCAGALVKLWYLQDITGQERQHDELLCLHQIIDAVNEGVLVSDPTGKIVLYNKQIARFEGLSRSQVIGRHLTEVYAVTPENSEHLTVNRTKKPILDLNQNYVTSAGKEIHLVASTYPVLKDGKIKFVFSISRNVTKIHQLLAKTVELQEKLLPVNSPGKLSNGTRFTFTEIIGASRVMQNVIDKAMKAAQSPSPVLLYGETGTGKELFAQSIHNAGPSIGQPFVAINCAAIPESLLESLLFGTVKGAFTGAENTKGLFEQAGSGTLFLDEIDSMSVNLQAKLLRVLQEKSVRSIGANVETPIHCRIISSTNMDPWQCVLNHTLRKDLYFRLAVISLAIPPLRERYKDVELLANFFMQKYARLYGKQHVRLSPEYCNVLLQHTWPGNVRELEHALESSIALLDDEEELTLQHLPSYLRSRFSHNNYEYTALAGTPASLSGILAEVEKRVILNALESSGWNISRAARAIRIGRQNMQYRMRKLQIERPATAFGGAN